MIQPNPHFTVHWYLLKEASYKKKEKELSGSFWEINILTENLTQTMDDSALEKFLCLSADWANKKKENY